MTPMKYSLLDGLSFKHWVSSIPLLLMLKTLFTFMPLITGLWSAMFLNWSEGGEPSSAKTCLFSANQIALMAAPYFYNLHNASCLPNAYSMFAMCEWTIVVSNVLFHILSIPRDYPAVFPELKESKKRI